MAVLVSTKLLYQYVARTVLAREWRIVMIPEEESSMVTFVDLYNKIVDHSLDPMEPFILPEEHRNASIRVHIGKAQSGINCFQAVPLAVKVMDAVSAFGMYVKFFVLCEDLQASSTVLYSGVKRNASEVGNTIKF